MTDRRTEALGIYVGPTKETATRVGTLVQSPSLDVTFQRRKRLHRPGPDRPVLSAAWLAPGDEGLTIGRLLDTSDKGQRGGMLPPWFANLLPEGALLSVVERQMGTGHHTQFAILRELGHDLPGAVWAVPEDGWTETAPSSRIETKELPPVRFSLAGVQLKFSIAQARRRTDARCRRKVGQHHRQVAKWTPTGTAGSRIQRNEAGRCRRRDDRARRADLAARRRRTERTSTGSTANTCSP